MSSLSYLALGVVGAAWALTLTALTAPPTTNGFDMQRRMESLMAPEPVSLDSSEDEAAMAEPLLRRLVGPAIRATGRLVARRLQGATLRDLRQRLLQAEWTITPEVFYARRLAALLVGLAFGGLALATLQAPGSVMVGGMAVALGLVAVPSMLKSRLRARGKLIARDLPGVLDLLSVAMEAGLSLDGALEKICTSEKGPLGREFFQVMNEVRYGRPRLEALTAMAERNAVPDLTEVMSAVVQAEPLGIGLARVFRAQAEDTRRKRRQRAEEKGQKAPIKMLMPMLGCVFPTIFILLLGPAVVTLITASSGRP